MKVLILILLLLNVISLSAQVERKFIRRGTLEYGDEKFVDSENNYRKALNKDDKSFEARFNLADALYKQKKLDEALKEFELLNQTESDPSRIAKINHNIGNIRFAQQKYDESIEAYKKSLRNNPNDNETRYNLIAAQKMKDNKDQNKQDQQKQQQEQDQKKQEQQKQDQQQQDQNMSKEDAQRLLNAVQQDENDLQKNKKKIRNVKNKQIEKNW